MKEETQTFKVFKLESYNPIANLLVIITIRNTTEFCRSEYFVLIQPNHIIESTEDIAIKPNRLSFQKFGRHTVNPELFIEDVEEYMTNQAKDIVENHLKMKFYEKSEKEGIKYEDWYLIKLIQTKKEDILGLWMRGKCMDEIEDIQIHTKNKELREFLDKLVEAPIFTIEEL